MDELIQNREENLAKRQDHELAGQRRIQEKEAHDKKMLLIDTMIEVLKIVFYYIWDLVDAASTVFMLHSYI